VLQVLLLLLLLERAVLLDKPRLTKLRCDTSDAHPKTRAQSKSSQAIKRSYAISSPPGPDDDAPVTNLELLHIAAMIQHQCHCLPDKLYASQALMPWPAAQRRSASADAVSRGWSSSIAETRSEGRAAVASRRLPASSRKPRR